jgi:hypothetical protein
MKAAYEGIGVTSKLVTESEEKNVRMSKREKKKRGEVSCITEGGSC